MLAPGAKCPDCILAARRARDEAKLAPPPQPPPSTAGVAAPATADVVQARDIAVRACLRKGPASFDEVLAAMPEEPLLTDDQRRLATNNCLSRLRLKRQIDMNGGVWRLIA